ncbi:MAG: DUF5343 domain-containing protein [Rubrivivax sp.]|nr:DUF5343 domain-containing protein [Pyrinomonadaceae bacterium]
MSQNPPNGVESKRPPYISYKTLKNFLNSFTTPESIPSDIDRSVLPSSMSGGNQVGVISTLKFLGLITETGQPTQSFFKYVSSSGDERKAVLREVLTEGYAFLLTGVDIERATTKGVIEKFKEVGVSGDTIRKAILFFQFAAKDAELKISSHIKPYMGTRTNKAAKPRGKGATNADEEGEDGGDDSTGDQPPVHLAQEKTPYQVLIDILSPDMEDDEQEAVWTLIRYLKRQETMAE